MADQRLTRFVEDLVMSLSLEFRPLAPSDQWPMREDRGP